MNKLLFGDNLDWLRNREIFPDASIDLIYLDPPFNSKRDFAVLFKSPKGQESEAQMEAFKDTWHWNQQAEREFDEILNHGNTSVSELMRALRDFLGENDMMAYLTMMANRLLELHRVLKPTGSLYLHCDPTASHYLKILLDGVFGKENFRSEIIWRRTGAHNKATRWAPIHDTIFFFTKSDKYVWNHPKLPYMAGHVSDNFIADGKGGYKTAYYGNVLTGSGIRNGESGQVWRGFNPTAKDRHWAVPGKIWEEAGIDPTGLGQHEKLDLLFKKGFIKIEPGAAWPMYERTITKNDGPATSDIWAFQPYTEGTVFGTKEGIDADVSWLKPQDEERLGYPTQKPLALLHRIISASSNPGDAVLDPFCGCGTAVHAAQTLKRKWIGIDITSFAISLIEDRLKKAFPENAFTKGQQRLKYETEGLPKDLESARNLASRGQHGKYQFQWWVVKWLLAGQPWQDKKKGADGGIDGIKYFTVYETDAKVSAHKKASHKKTGKIIINVKGGENVGPAMVKDLIATVARESAEIGFFVTLAKHTPAMIAEAASAGIYKTPNGKKYPRIQLLTVEGLMNKTQRAEHPDYEPDVNYKSAKAEANVKQPGLI